MHALWNLAISHLAMALLWSLPAARGRCARSPAAALVVGYLIGSTLLIAITFVLGWFGYSRRLLVWGLWVLVWTLAALRKPLPKPLATTCAHLFTRQNLVVCLLTLLGAALMLVDPWRHASPASVTAYHFVTHLSVFLHESTIYCDYILGLPILLGQTRLFESDALELMRWGPPLLAAAGIPAFFIFFSRLFGPKTGLLSALLLAGSALFAPIAGYQILFPQFVSIGLALPTLLFAFPRALRSGARAEITLTAAALLLLAFTGTYFALLVASGIFAWLLLTVALRKAGWATFFRGARLLAIVPLWIAFHYGIAVPHAQPQKSGKSLPRQIEAFARNPSIPSSEQASVDHLPKQWEHAPILRGVGMFLAPKRLHLLRPTLAQTALFWLMALLALPLLKHPASSRGLLGFSMLFSTFATVTGMFDLPAYQGRHLFLMLLLGIPALSFFAVSTVIPFAIRLGIPLGNNPLFRLVVGAALLSCIPSILHPPEAGKTIPASPDLMIRQIPEDDLLIGLARSIPVDQPQSLIFLARENTPRLPGEIVETLNRTPAFSGLKFHRVEPPRLAEFGVFRKYPPRFAALSRADWNTLEAQPARTWDGLPLGPPVFQTDRLVCVRLDP